MKEKYLFRFVPTMRCNFNCNYCFLGDNGKRRAGTMFDDHKVEEWIEAMKQYSDKEIEIYMWGGEPFLLDDTYTLLREWLKMDHITGGCRIDTNLFYAEKIAQKCPSSKLKLNCSYHMQYLTLEEEFEKIKLLKSLDMIGMMNFVASEYNMTHLKNEYHMTVHDLIEKFAEIGVFVNVAGDFAIANDEKNPRRKEYMDFILQFISPEEWVALRGEEGPCKCNAGTCYFTVFRDGTFRSCINDDKVYGNFFDGTLTPDAEGAICSKNCPSIVSYPFRADNQFTPWTSLVEYVKRNEQYRKSIQTKVNFEF